jgi:hypothetical protein
MPDKSRPDIHFSIGATHEGVLAALGSIQIKMVSQLKDPTTAVLEEERQQLKAALRTSIALEVLGWLQEWGPEVLEEYAVEVRVAIVRDPVEMVDYLERHAPEELARWLGRAQQRQGPHLG